MWQIAFSFFLGILSWSLAEYCIHRWLGHDRRFRPNFFAKEHIRHHALGDWFAPASWKIKAVIAAFVPLALLSCLLAGPRIGLTYISGFFFFYTCYEVLHRRLHTHEGWGTYGQWARRHHFSHHFSNSNFNHGVTSPLWDLCFRTYRTPCKIRVPAKKAMIWLVTPEGSVKPRFTAHFEIPAKRRAAAA